MWTCKVAIVIVLLQEKPASSADGTVETGMEDLTILIVALNF